MVKAKYVHKVLAYATIIYLGLIWTIYMHLKKRADRVADKTCVCSEPRTVG